MLGHVVGIDEDIVQVDHDGDIKHVREDVVHKALESGRGVGKTEGHYEPFVRAVPSTEGRFPFVSFGNTNEVIGVLEIGLGLDTSFTGSIKKVGNEGKRVLVFFRNTVKSTKIYAKTK